MTSKSNLPFPRCECTSFTVSRLELSVFTSKSSNFPTVSAQWMQGHASQLFCLRVSLHWRLMLLSCISLPHSLTSQAWSWWLTWLPSAPVPCPVAHQRPRAPQDTACSLSFQCASPYSVPCTLCTFLSCLSVRQSDSASTEWLFTTCKSQWTPCSAPPPTFFNLREAFDTILPETFSCLASPAMSS